MFLNYKTYFLPYQNLLKSCYLQHLNKQKSEIKEKRFLNLHPKKMMKKPFGNIGKLKKQKPAEQQVARLSKQKKQESQTSIPQRPPTGRLKLNQGKNIYDAVRKVDEEKQQPSGVVLKPTLTFKKNKLGKGQKVQTPQSFHNNENAQKQKEQNFEQSTDNHSNIPRPTPLFNRNKAKLLVGKSRQKPVVQKEQPMVQMGGNKKRMAYVHEDENMDHDNNNNQLPAEEEPSKKLIKPNLFKGVGDKKRPNVPASNDLSSQPQQIRLNNSQVYQQYNNTEEKKQKFNFQKMLNLQKQAINLERTQNYQQVSQSKIEKQTKRSRQLSQLLNLQIDLYEPLVSLQSTTPFQVYISKIKSGFLKNSCDAAFDQKNDVESQTVSFQYVDFSNQCPQDYQLSSGFHKIINKSQNGQQVDDLILKISPVIEQLLKPSKTISMPPTSLLAFVPVFKTFVKCPLPTFIYFSQIYNYSLLTMGEKLYICEDEITCALDLGGNRIAGLKNGKIMLWNGQNDRGSVMYKTIQEIIQSQNFQLPVYITNDLDKLSPYMCEGEIVGLVTCDQMGSFYSLDSLGKLIKWEIQKVNKKTVLTPKQITQFNKETQKRYLTCFGIKRRNQTYYISTSSGIILWSEHAISHRLQTPPSIKQFYLPKRSSLVYCLTQFNSLLVYITDYHLPILEVQLDVEDGQSVQELIIPEIEHQNRQVALFYVTYLLTDNGTLYEMKIIDKQPQITKLKSTKKAIEDQQGNGSRSKRLSAVIFSGVNAIGQNIQKINLYRDLKCTTQIQSLPVDLSANVNNLKSVIMKNKEFLSQIMENNNICLV